MNSQKEKGKKEKRKKITIEHCMKSKGVIMERKKERKVIQWKEKGENMYEETSLKRELKSNESEFFRKSKRQSERKI